MAATVVGLEVEVDRERLLRDVQELAASLHITIEQAVSELPIANYIRISTRPVSANERTT